ncbi:HipA family kinase [Pseudorhodoferax sp.]|uniref:HipA family kinase n=1 Tax=Pseudorhodoferax sp. TaxID=1993553 RepID=UPI002DD6778D|nr:HipA family kinase [Pseudorhodoferax sp.]
MRTVTATRYVTPLREGGSLPALVEADDDGLYVLKFRGAGQGCKALVAELLAGELARHLGLAVPQIVFMQLDPVLARTEPDPEIQDLIRASGGLNLALDFLPGAVGFDPLAHAVEADWASTLVWFDALVCNVDRSARNTNLMWWHGRPWLIDHGAALVFHHQWSDPVEQARRPFAAIREHVLLPRANTLAAAHERLSARLDLAVLAQIVDAIPDDWLRADTVLPDPAAQRAAYRSYFAARLADAGCWLQPLLQAAEAARR